MLKFEKEIWEQGYELIAGIDEAGRGPLAGPVVAAAVIFPKDFQIEGVNDSKKMTAEQRESKFLDIQSYCVAYGIGIVSAREIDEINILEATKKAALKALKMMKMKPDYIITDFLKIAYNDLPVKPIVKGDAQSHSIAAASILAKVTRDNIMEEYHKEWPEYNFIKNKGYGTAAHLTAIEKYGPSTIHRMTFKGVSWFDSTPNYSASFKKISERIDTIKDAKDANTVQSMLNSLCMYLPEPELDCLNKKLKEKIG